MNQVSRPHQSRGHFTWILIIISVVGLVLLTLPTAAMVLRALEARDVLDDPRSRTLLREALVLSLWTSMLSLAIIVVIGTPIAWVLARVNFPGRTFVDALIDLPIILPPAVAGIALLSAFGRRGILGTWLEDLGITVGFTTTAVILAQIFVSAPFYIRTARAGFSHLDQTIEEAAADLGAAPWRVFWTVTLPLCRASLIAGAVLAWARALGEFGATIMFAGNLVGVTQTMPLAIYERFGAGDLKTALVMSGILLIASVSFLIVVRLLGEQSTPR